VTDIINSQQISVSLAQLTDVSPWVARELKKALTPKTVATAKTRTSSSPKEQAAFISDAVLGDSAPRALGVMNNIPCEVVLDGGSTGNMVSLALVRKLGIQKMNPSDSIFIMANGDKQKPLGVVNLSLGIQGVHLPIQANVFSRPEYDCLLGRFSMKQFRISTSWETHKWYISKDGVEQEIPVTYQKRRVQFRQPVVEAQLDESTSETTACTDSETELYWVEQVQLEQELLLTLESEESQSKVTPELPFQSNEKEPWQFVQLAARLTGTQKRELNRLLHGHRDTFATSYKDISHMNVSEFHVDTGTAAPIYHRPRRLAHAEWQFVKDELQRLVDERIVVPSKSPWAFPIVVVRHKRTGKMRMCMDIRSLNKVTIRDAYPIPLFEDVTDPMLGAEFLTGLDLLKGFHQIKATTDSIPKLTMTTPFGTFLYQVMPFGVVNGPATFSRAISIALRGCEEFCSVFIDDITVFSKTWPDHCLHLSRVFDQLMQANFRLNAEKCLIGCEELELLGCIVSGKGIKVLPSRVEALLALPDPTDKKTLRSTIAAFSFVRKHIQNFSDIAQPLTKLLGMKSRFQWTPECARAYQALKEMIKRAPMMALPDYSKPMCVYTDASDVGLGGQLTQRTVDATGKLISEEPVHFASRLMTPAERNYSAVEREGLAVVFCLKKFRKYLLGHDFTLYTDNSALKFMFNKNEITGRLARWVMQLQEYRFTAVHLPGKKNVVADVLSRYPLSPREDPDMLEHFIFQAEEDSFLATEVKQDMAPQYEEYLGDVIRAKMTAELPSDEPRRRKTIAQLRSYCVLGDKLVHLGHNGQAKVVPHLEERPAILANLHGLGHYGFNAFVTAVTANYWWPKLREDVRTFLKQCTICQEWDREAPNKYARYKVVRPRRMFERLSIDFAGPLPETQSGNRYVILAIDSFSKWPIAKAVASNDGVTAARFIFEDICCVFGPPAELLSDNGTHFVNQLVDQLTVLMEIHHILASPYRPQTNGQGEKLVQTMKITVYKLASKHGNNWDRFLPVSMYSYRIKPHTATGIAPLTLVTGLVPSHKEGIRKLLTELDLPPAEDNATHRIDQIRQAETNLNHYLKGREAAEMIKSFEIQTLDKGDQVYIRKAQRKAMEPYWEGPYRITKRVSKRVYEVGTWHGKPRRVNIARLKKAQGFVTSEPTMAGGSCCVQDAESLLCVSSELNEQDLSCDERIPDLEPESDWEREEL
jgi:hypothetical protein